VPLRRLVRQAAPLALAVAALMGVAGCSDDDGDQEAFCRLIAERRDLLLAVSVDPGSAEPAVEAYREIVEVAPGAIRDEAEDLLELLEGLRELDTEDDAFFGEAFERLFDSEVRASAERFTDYVANECGVNLRTSAATTAAPPTSPAG